jgi:hypothetical protein
MAEAETYGDWYESGKELDVLFGNDLWYVSIKCEDGKRIADFFFVWNLKETDTCVDWL